jgi:hypothetical protein
MPQPAAFSQPKLVAVPLSLPQRMFDALADRARVMNVKPAEYVRRLVDAAYAARIGQERAEEPLDRDLDRQVRAIFLMADAEPEYIATALGLPRARVEKIIAGWKQAGSSLASRDEPAAAPPVPPAPRATAAADDGRGSGEPAPSADVQSDRGAGAAKSKSRAWTDADRLLLKELWAEGLGIAEIAARLGREAAAVQQYASGHRGLCPKRRG